MSRKDGGPTTAWTEDEIKAMLTIMYSEWRPDAWQERGKKSRAARHLDRLADAMLAAREDES